MLWGARTLVQLARALRKPAVTVLPRLQLGLRDPPLCLRRRLRPRPGHLEHPRPQIPR